MRKTEIREAIERLEDLKETIYEALEEMTEEEMMEMEEEREN